MYVKLLEKNKKSPIMFVLLFPVYIQYTQHQDTIKIKLKHNFVKTPRKFTVAKLSIRVRIFISANMNKKNYVASPQNYILIRYSPLNPLHLASFKQTHSKHYRSSDIAMIKIYLFCPQVLWKRLAQNGQSYFLVRYHDMLVNGECSTPF